MIYTLILLFKLFRRDVRVLFELPYEMEHVLIARYLGNFRHGIPMGAQKGLCDAYAQRNDVLNGGDAEEFFIKFEKARLVEVGGLRHIVHIPVFLRMRIDGFADLAESIYDFVVVFGGIAVHVPAKAQKDLFRINAYRVSREFAGAEEFVVDTFEKAEDVFRTGFGRVIDFIGGKSVKIEQLFYGIARKGKAFEIHVPHIAVHGLRGLRSVDEDRVAFCGNVRAVDENRDRVEKMDKIVFARSLHIGISDPVFG